MSWSTDHPIYRSSQDGMKKADKVGELPEQPGKAVFDQYAGYFTVDAASGKRQLKLCLPSHWSCD